MKKSDEKPEDVDIIRARNHAQFRRRQIERQLSEARIQMVKEHLGSERIKNARKKRGS